MKTYQDLLEAMSMAEFIPDAIREYKSSEFYHWAREGEAYSRQLNTTIRKYIKLLYTMSGKSVPDNFSANHKCASNFLDIFSTQETQYLLGNGVVFNNDRTKNFLENTRYKFDDQIQTLGYDSLIHGVSFGFYNLDHIDAFTALDFVPLWDEEDGSLKAGIRFWQIDFDKPLRATLYELDGYTDYIQKDNRPFEILKAKRAYKFTTITSELDGTEILAGENYPGFPIIPFWGNKKHQSSLVGMKENIDCYDLIKSGYANDVDDASMIYWTLENCGGMDDIDLAEFVQKMHTVRAAAIDGDGGARAEAHTLDVPTAARDSALTRLQDDLYRDAQALNTTNLTASATTATAIRAAYQNLDDKVDGFEYCVREFIKGILAIAQIEDEPIFKRNRIANETEETTMVLSAAQYLDDETILNHLPFINVDEIEDILGRLENEETERFEESEVKEQVNEPTGEEPARNREESDRDIQSGTK